MSDEPETEADEEPAASDAEASGSTETITEENQDPEERAEPSEAAGQDVGDPEAVAEEGVEGDGDGEGDTEADADDGDGLQEGDFVRLAYTARTVEGDRLVDTTDAEVAEEEGVEADQEFEPRVIVLGEGHIFDAVEQDILSKDVGDTGSVTVPAAEAFGEYQEEEVRTVSASKIDEDDRYPGAQVTVDGEQGYVETIIGGRARVDFNHPLAGDDIEYDYEIVGRVEDREERARGMLSMFLDVEPEVWFETDEVEEEQMVEPDEDDEDAEPEFETVTTEKETLYIEAPPQLSFDQQWLFQKQQIAQQLIDMLGIDRVIVQETIDGSGGMMGGMGGMMGGMGGMGGDIEEELEDADVDAEEIAEELDEDL